jgi:NAD+ synthase
LPIVKLDERPYDVLPLSGLTKRRVRALAPSLGAEDRLVMKVPTADLELLTLQRPDEDSYGISYKNIDDFLEGKEVTAEITSNIKCFYEATWQKRSLPVAILPDGN